MTITEILTQKYQDQLQGEKQISLFNECCLYLEKAFDYSVKKRANGKDAFYLKIEDIDRDDFYSKYKHWLYDNVSGLFFVNIRAKHHSFRRGLLMIELIVEGWTGDLSLLNDDKLDLESIYTAKGLGFHETGAQRFGSTSRTVMCAELFNPYRYAFLQGFSMDYSDFPKDEAEQELLVYLEAYTD